MRLNRSGERGTEHAHRAGESGNQPDGAGDVAECGLVEGAAAVSQTMREQAGHLAQIGSYVPDQAGQYEEGGGKRTVVAANQEYGGGSSSSFGSASTPEIRCLKTRKEKAIRLDRRSLLLKRLLHLARF
jgi:hypothetical protein